MQEETFVRKDMAEYKNMMNGVHNVASCNHPVSLEKSSESSKQKFYDEKISKTSKSSCSNVNISVDTSGDNSTDKTIDPVSLSSRLSGNRYNNNATNGNAGNMSNYWINGKSNKMVQKKLNVDNVVEEGNNTTDASAYCNNKNDGNYNNKVDTGKYMGENKSGKIPKDGNTNSITTSTNMEQVINNSTSGFKGNMGTYKARKNEEESTGNIDCEVKLNGDINTIGMTRKTPKSNVINDNSNETLLSTIDEKGNDNSSNNRRSGSFSTVERNKENETTEAVLDANYISSLKNANGKAGTNSVEGVCNMYMNSGNMHHEENLSNGCANLGNDTTGNEMENGNTFRGGFKGNAKICGNEKPALSGGGGMNSTHIKGVNENEAKHMNRDIKENEKNCEDVENKTNNEASNIEKIGGSDGKNHSGNSRSRNGKNTNSSNMNKKENIHKNKNSTLSSESGNSLSEVHNSSYKLNSASSNSYHNISSISSLNADAPEFVPSTKSAQNNLPFNNFLWSNYYQELSSPFNSVANSSVITPAGHAAAAGGNANVTGNTSGAVHNSLIGASVDIGNSLLNTGVRDGGGTGDGNATSANLLNTVNSNSTSDNNSMSLNSTSLSAPGNATGMITNTTGGMINRGESSNAKHNSNILSSNRNVVGGSSNSGVVGNMVNVSGMKHNMHENNVTTGAATNTATNTTNGAMGSNPNIDGVSGIGNVANVGGSGVATIGHMPNLHNSPNVNSPQTIHNSPTIVAAVTGGGGNSQSNCNFMNPNLIHSSNNLRTTSFMSGSENSAPFHHMGNTSHAHQNFQPNSSLMHPPNVCVDSSYLLNNHHSTITTHQPVMFTSPMSYGNSIPSAGGHHEIPFPQAASMYGAFPNNPNPNVMGNNSLTSHKNAGLNMTPYNFLPCVMPPHPQLQPNGPMNMNSMEHHCIGNSANAHMKIPYNHGNQSNRRNLFNHFSSSPGGNSNVASIHSGTNISEANFEHGNGMNAMMGGNMNYGFSGFGANQNNSMHLNNENSNIHMSPAVGNNIPLNNGAGVICLGAPLHMNNTGNMPPPHHHMSNVSSIGNIGSIGSTSSLNGSMHVGNMHMNHNMILNNNANMNKQKRNISYSERNKQYNNYRDNKNAVKNSMMGLNSAVSSFNHFNNTSSNDAYGSQNTLNNRNMDNNNMVSGSANNTTNNMINASGSNNGSGIGGNNNGKQENKKHNKYSGSSGFNQNYNMNNTINNVSGNTKNTYTKNMKGDNAINNSSSSNREENNNSVNGTLNYYHRNNANNTLGGGVSVVHSSGMSLKEVNTDSKELDDNFNEHNNSAYNNEGSYSNKGKNYNMNNVSVKNKGMNATNINGSAMSSGTNASVGNMMNNTINNMNHMFTSEGVNEKGRHGNVNMESDKNNKDEHKSSRNNYRNNSCSNNTKNNMRNTNINHSEFIEEKNGTAISKRGEMGKEKNNKHNESNYKKSYNEMSNVIGSMGGVVVNGNSNEQIYGNRFQNNTENKRNARNTDNSNGNNNKMNDKKMKNEEDKKSRKKNSAMNISSSGAGHVIPNNAENENVNKIGIENSVNANSSDVINENGVDFNNNSNTGVSNNKGGNYSIKINKGYDRKTGEFGSWAKIAKMNLNKKKEKISNVSVNVNNVDGISGGGRNQNMGNNSNSNQTNTNNNGNNAVDAMKEKDQERGYVHSGKGSDTGFTQNEVMNKDRSRKIEDDREREREGQQKNVRKNQEEKFESNARNKKFSYSNNKDYNIEKNMKEKQKSKFENRKGELNERKMNHVMHNNNNMINNMANDVSSTGGNSNTNRAREKVKIQNVEIKEIDEKFLNSIKSDEMRLGKKNNEHKNIGSATVNYANESRAEGCSEKTQALNAGKSKEIMEKEKIKESEKVKEKEKEKEKLSTAEGMYHNGKVQGGTTLAAAEEPVSTKNEELSVKREGPTEGSNANLSPKESSFSTQDNKWNKSTENASKKSNSGVSLNKDTSNRGSNNAVSTNVNGSVPVYDRVSSSNNSAKNSIWEGKTSFAEVAKRKPQRGMREVKSESLINDGKNSNANKNDKGNRKEHSRYSSNVTMRGKGSGVGTSTGNNVSSSKEIKKRNNDDKEERAGTQMNNVESIDQEKPAASVNVPKIIKEKQGSDDVVDNAKVQKESGTSVPLGESKDKVNDLKSSSRGNERRDWKDGKESKFKGFKNERKEKNKEIEEEKEKWEKEKEKEKGMTMMATVATAYPSRGSNKINNVEVNIGEYEFNEKKKANVVKSKEDSVNTVEVTVEENVDGKKENGQGMESSEDISKKKKKKKKKPENEKEAKGTEVEDIKETPTMENKDSEREEKNIIEMKTVKQIEETQAHVEKKEMKVKQMETKQDLIEVPIEKERVEEEVTEVATDLKLKETLTEMNKDATNNTGSTDRVAMVKAFGTKTEAEPIQVEEKQNSETVVLQSEMKVEIEEKVDLKKIDQNVTPKEETLWVAPSKTEKIEETKENVQRSTETNDEVVKEVAKVNQSEKREDDLLARLEKKKNQLEKQKDKVTNDKCVKEQEKEGKEKCNMSATNTTTDNSDNTNSNETGQQVNEQDTNPDDAAEKDNRNNKKGDSDKKGEKDGESGEKDKEEQDSRITEMRMRMKKKYTKNELLLIYVSHNWKKEQHGYFEPHDLEWFNTFPHYVSHENFTNIRGGNNYKINSNSIRDNDMMRNSLLMSNDFKNTNSNSGGYPSGNSNMIGSNANNVMKNSHSNTSSAVSMNNMNNNNNNAKRYVMNLGRTSTTSVSNIGGDDEGDWRKNSVAKNIMNNLFSNVSSNNILFNNRGLGSNMMLDHVSQNSSGVSNNITSNLLMKNINSSSDWRKNDGEKLKGFFDATRAKDSVGTWRKSTPTKTIESSWLAKQNKLKEDQFTSLMRKLRGILNRLTFEKFDLLFEELIKINFTKTEEVIGLLKLVFEKAVSQHHFVQMYVQLCVKLSNHFLSKKLENNESFCFRKLLINQCQDSFESYLKPIEYPPNMDEDDKFEYEQKYKNKVRGNMIFVGELVKAKIMSVPVAFVCINELLKKREAYIKEKQDTNVGNLHLEALCMFLNTIGELIDVNEKIKKEQEQMISNLYDTLNKLVNDDNIIFRVRCLIKDVIENRNEKWNKKFAHKLEGPTTLSDLHEKVMKETIDHNTRSAANNNMGGNNMNYHDRLNSNLNNMRNNLLRGNFMNSNNNYMNNNNNSSGANNANNNMNNRGMGGMKGLDGMKNMKKMAMNLCKNKPATKLSDENKSGANDSSANNNSNSGTNSYYDLMAKSHLGDFGRGAGFLGEGTDNSQRNVDSSRMMGINSSNTNNSNNMGKDKSDNKSFSRIYNMNKVNELMRRNDIRNNNSDTLGDMNVLRSANASNENNTKLNFMNRNIKDSTATSSTTGAPTGVNNNENKSKEEEAKKKEMTEEEFEKNIFPEIEHVIQVAAGTDDWESLTKQFEEINIPSQFQEKANDAVLKFTLKKFACCQNLEKSVDFFNWIIESIVMQCKYLSEDAFRKSWKTFMLCEEQGYEFMKEDYPLLPTIIKNFVTKIEQLDEKGSIFDSATVQEMKNIIKNDISMNNGDEDGNNN